MSELADLFERFHDPDAYWHSDKTTRAWISFLGGRAMIWQHDSGWFANVRLAPDWRERRAPGSYASRADAKAAAWDMVALVLGRPEKAQWAPDDADDYRL